MNPVISDPDNKINMSLDEIIRLTHGDINYKLRKNRTKKKKRKCSKKISDSDHSVPLFTSSEGVSIYVSKKSPLLAPDVKQSFLKAVNNRALNAELLNKSTKIIPAKYELVKTDNGVERILVPVKNYICKPLRKTHQKNKSHKRCFTLHEEIPPLLASPLLKPVSSPVGFKEQLNSKMEVDAVEDDDVVVLKCIKKEPELIDVELNMPVSVSKNKSAINAVKTLNDRFTRLTGNFKF